MSMISELVEELIDNADLHTKELHDLMYRAAYTIEMPSEKVREPKQEWVSCSERSPEENGKSYLTYQGDSRYGWCQVLRYDDGWNCLNGDKENEIKGVIAWMPLPDPPTGANDD